MKRLLLTKGVFTLVDDADYPFLSQWNWHVTPNGYAARTVTFVGSNGTRNGSKSKIKILMHRQILGVPDGILTDHVDENKLNNQKSNLRMADKAQNEYNSGAPKNNSTGYKGVYYDRRGTKKFFARCIARGKRHSCGYFDTVEQAAAAYNNLAMKFHGRFARLNVIGNGKKGKS